MINNDEDDDYSDNNEFGKIFDIQNDEPIIDGVIEHEVNKQSTNEQIEISTKILSS